MFDNCKNEYEACDKALTFIYGQDYLDSLSEEDYHILVRKAWFLFQSGMKWQKEQMKRAAVDGTIGSTISGSEQHVSAYIGYGEYGKNGDKLKLYIFENE
jgi:hypothetical protein